MSFLDGNPFSLFNHENQGGGRIHLKTTSSMPQQSHVTVALSTHELERMLNKDFDPKDPKNKLVLPSYENLRSGLLEFGVRDYSLDIQCLIPTIMSLTTYDGSVPELEDIVDRSLKITVEYNIDCVNSMGFQGGDDPMKVIKENVSVYNNFKSNKYYQMLRSQLIIEKILKMGVYLSGSKDMKILKSKSKYHKTKQYYIGGWIENSTSFTKYYENNKIPGFKFLVSSDWVFIHYSNKWYIGHRDHFTMLADIRTQRNNGLFYCIASEMLNNHNTLSVSEYFHQLSFIDRLLSAYGNSAYKIISDWEARCVATLLEDDDEYLDNWKLFKSGLLDDIKDLADKYGDPNLLESYNIHMKSLKDLKNVNPNKVAHVFGMCKLGGNPTVSPVDAFEKVKSISKKKRAALSQFIDDSLANLCELFAIRYKDKHGSWPPMDISKLETDSYLYDVIINNYTLSKDHRFYRYKDWNKITFQKVFNITDDIMISDLLSDKTLSAYKDEIIRTLEKQGSIGNVRDRSVIIRFLREQFKSVREFLDEIERDGFPLSARIIALRIKELELKMDGRCFGMTTFLVRTYIVITEAILKKHMLPYIPEITMTESYIELTKKIHSNTKSMREHVDGHSHLIMASMDFERWNSNMLGSDTAKVFSFLSNLFGYQHLFTRTAEMFVDTFYYLSSNGVGYTSDIFKCERPQIYPPTYKGQLGGIEGLRQTGWTIKTVGDILAALRGSQVDFNIMGQGDNQVLLFQYHKSMSKEMVKFEHEKNMKKLFSFLKFSGPPLKPKETWQSSILFIYGKRIIYHGTELDQGPKRIYKCYEISTEGLPTMESALSSLVANCMAAVQASTNCLQPLFLYGYRAAEIYLNSTYFSYVGSNLPLIWSNIEERLSFDILRSERSHGKTVVFRDHYDFQSINTLDEIKSQLTSMMRKRSTDLILALMIQPSILGGYPNLNPNQMLLRNFPDILVDSITFLKHFRNHTKRNILKSLIGTMLDMNVCSDINPERLMLDPVSLNIPRATSPGDSLRRTVTEVVHRSPDTRNQQYRDVYSAALQSMSDFAEHLFTMKPLRPLVMNELYKATQPGIANTMIQKFSKMNTLVRISMSSRGQEIVEDLKLQDEEYFSCVIFNLVSFNVVIKEMCSRKRADVMRNESWGKVIEGISAVHPFDAMIPRTHIYCQGQDDIDGYILWKFKDTSHLSSTALKVIGDCTPNLGTITKEKYNHESKRYILELAQPVSRAANLMRYLNWVTPEHGNLANLIRYIVSTVTDADFSVLIPMTEKISGEVDHRLSTNALDRGGSIPTSYNLHTYHIMCTDTLNFSRKGGLNDNIVYQAAFVAAGSVSSMCIEYTPSVVNNMNIHLHFKNNRCCVKEIDSNYSEVDKPKYQLKSLLPPFTNNSFLFIPKEQMVYHQDIESNKYPTMNLHHNDQVDDMAKHQLSLIAAMTPVVNVILRIDASGDHHTNKSAYSLSGLVSIFNNSNVVDVFRVISFFIFCNIMCSYVTDFFDDSTKDEILLKSLSVLENINQGSFNLLGPLFQVKENIHKLSRLYPELQMQTGSYWRLSDSANMSKQIVKSMIVDYIEQKTSFVSDILVITPDTRVYNHPLIIRLVELYLATDLEDLDIFNTIIKTKNYLHKMITNQIPLTTDLLSSDNDLRLMNIIGIRPKEIEDLRDKMGKCKAYFIDGVYDKILKLFPYSGEELPTTCEEEVSYGVFPSSVKTIDISYAILSSDDHRLINKDLNTLQKIKPEKERSLKNRVDMSYARPRINATGAIYKVAELHSSRSMSFKFKHMNILELGGGAGSSALFSLQFFPNTRLYFNDLVDIAATQVNMLPHCFPSAFGGKKIYLSRLIKPRLNYEGKSDACDPSYPLWLRENIDEDFYMIMSDIEGSFSDPRKEVMIVLNVLRLAHLFNSGIAYIKMYTYNTFLFREIIKMAVQFADVSINRLSMSNQNKTEVYVELKNFRNNPFMVQIDEMDLRYRMTSYPTKLRLEVDRIIEHTIDPNIVYQLITTYYQEFSKTFKNKLVLQQNLATCPYLHYLTISQERIFENAKRLGKEYKPVLVPSQTFKALKFAVIPSSLIDIPARLREHMPIRSSIQRTVSNYVVNLLSSTLSHQDYLFFLEKYEELRIIYYKTIIGTIHQIVTFKQIDSRETNDTKVIIRVRNHVSEAMLKKLLSQRIPFQQNFGHLFESRVCLYHDFYPIPKEYRKKTLLADVDGTERILYLRKITPIDAELAKQLYDLDVDDLNGLRIMTTLGRMRESK